jgi:hypothetical protein
MRIGLLIGITLLAGSTVGQNQGPASPTFPGDSRTLYATVKAIQDKVNAQGEIRYLVVSQNPAKRETAEDHYAVQTRVVADAASCSLQVSGRMAREGKIQSQGSTTVRLRDVTALAVKTQTHLINEKTARMGVTGWKGKVTPETYALQLFRSGTLAGMFFFRDSPTADLVATNMSRAIELCGGAKVMP